MPIKKPSNTPPYDSSQFGSRSEQYRSQRSETPSVSAIMANNVSQERRSILANEVEQGLFRDGSGPTLSAFMNENGETSIGRVVSSVKTATHQPSLYKTADNMFRGVHGDVVKQIPEVYSPLWLTSNLNLPRDRATINAWCRSFFALNPFVHNAINLHSTYPICPA